MLCFCQYIFLYICEIYHWYHNIYLPLLQIYVKGYISLGVNTKLRDFNSLPRTANIIAPFYGSLSRCKWGAVYFHKYTKFSNDKRDKELLRRCNNDIKTHKNVTFSASICVVITWYRVQPVKESDQTCDNTLVCLPIFHYDYQS